METAHSELETLLDRYDEGDASAGKKVSELRAGMDPKVFLDQIRTILLQRPGSRAMRFIAAMLNFDDIIQMVLGVYRKSREEALLLATKLQAADPRFDTLFLKRYADKDVVNWSENELLIALDILDAVSERDRLVLGVSKFLRHPNPNLRSRAAKFLARRRPSLGLIADLARESDPIVRSGLIEGLYDRKEEFVAPLFRKHVVDADPNVAGSALLGFYQAGDPAAIPLIDEMAKDERPEFRESCSRVMGRTGDPRFSSTLAAQMSDTNEVVRRQALRSLGEMKKILSLARNQSSLRVVVLKHAMRGLRRQLLVTVSTNSGEAVKGIPGTKFFTKAGGAYVRDYEVEEYECATPINVGFILCEPPKGELSVREEFDGAVERCERLQGSRDTLEVSRLSHEIHLRCYAKDMHSSNTIVTRALSEIEFERPNLNVVLVGATSHTRAVGRLIEIGSRSAAKVHVIAISPEWRAPEVRQQVLSAGGYFRIAEPSELSQACFELYSAFLHNYRVTWEKGSGDLELEVRSDSGIGVGVYQMETSAVAV